MLLTKKILNTINQKAQHLIVIAVLSGCTSVSSIDKSTLPNNDRYKQAGYGYHNSYFAPENEKAIFLKNRQQNNSNLEERTQFKQIEEKLNKSIYINQYENNYRIQKYFENYDKIVGTTSMPKSKNDESASDLSYFDISLYNKTYPVENITTAKSLRSNNTVPLTQEYQDYLEEFYLQYGFYPKYLQTKSYKNRSKAKSTTWFDYHDSPHRYMVIKSTVK